MSPLSDLPPTQPARLDMRGDALDDFRIVRPVEVRALLRQLVDHTVPMHISSPSGHSYSTTLWTMDAPRGKLGFHADADDPQLQRLLDCNEAAAVGHLESIRLQFDVANLMLVHGLSACALQADLPHEVFRFQRRNSFRVRTPLLGTPTAQLRHPALPDMRLALRVMDISIGGCALFLPDDVPLLAPGVRMQGARLELDADTRFAATLLLHHVIGINPQSRGVRLGCALLDLSSEAQRALQRYIDQTQKRQRLLDR